MKTRAFLVLVLMTLLLAAFLPAAVAGEDNEAVSLTYKWNAGDRYTWTITTRSNGKISMAQGGGAGQAIDLDTTVSLTLFTDVLEVLDDGSARIKLSFGMISTDVKTPQGQTITVHVNPASGEVTIEGAGGQQPKQKLPDAVREMMAQGVTLTLTNKGEVTKGEGMEKLQQALRKVAGPRGAGFQLNQMISWIEPPLPDHPVKPGDEWEKTIPWVFGAGAKDQSTPKLTMKFRYLGKSNIDGRDCAKVQASLEVSGLDMSVEPGVVGPVGQEVKGLSMQLYITYYLDLETGHVVQAQGRIIQSGTVRQYGTVEVNGQEHNFDMTIQLDQLTTELEIKGTKE